MSDLHEEAICENQNILPVLFFSDRLNCARMDRYDDWRAQS
jgi:hypothetical protein